MRKFVYFILFSLFLTGLASADSWVSAYQDANVSLDSNLTGSVLWVVDGVNSTETGEYLNTSFSDFGNHWITASNTTDNMSFIVTVKRTLASSGVDEINDTDNENLITAINEENYTDIGTIVTNPYTNLMGRLFFIFLFVLPFGVIWVSHGSMAVPTVLALILGVLFIGFIPGQYVPVLLLFAAIAYGVGLFNVARDR